MPVIKSAKKKLRQDKKRTLQNSVFEESMRSLLKKAKALPTAESVRLATQAVDKAVKKHIVHKNKAARVKSALAKLLAGKAPKKAVAAEKIPTKVATKKKSAKSTK